MSVLFASFAFLLILSLGAAGNIGDPEEDDMDLLRRIWYPEDPGEHIGMTKRAGIRNFNVVKLRDFRRFLEIARKQQSLLSQQEVEPIDTKGWHIPDWIQGYMHTLGRRGHRVSNIRFSSWYGTEFSDMSGLLCLGITASEWQQGGQQS